MNKIECSVRFLTPAFVGDARQNGAWRTPPFKAQLRQFWRMVMAGGGRDYRSIRRIEARLFGHAWLEGEDAQKSRVRLRLSSWQAGRMSGHWPEIGKIQNGKASVDGGLYLGYGAVAWDKSSHSPKLVHDCAIQDGETATLRIGWRNDESGAPDGADQLLPALTLMHRYGTIGGRSRNGWGSYMFETDALPALDNTPYLIDWRDALRQSWAQGIGRDEKGPLVWQTRAPAKSWQVVMHTLAQLRSDLNQHFRTPPDRSLLSWPVTKKQLPRWNDSDRLPNSLRFKVIEKQGQPHGLVFHVPCHPGNGLWDRHPYDQSKLEHLWASVHDALDRDLNLHRTDA